jgi:hypothetical protein
MSECISFDSLFLFIFYEFFCAFFLGEVATLTNYTFLVSIIIPLCVLTSSFCCLSCSLRYVSFNHCKFKILYFVGNENKTTTTYYIKNSDILVKIPRFLYDFKNTVCGSCSLAHCSLLHTFNMERNLCRGRERLAGEGA